MSLALESRIGALTGGEVRLAAAIPDCQSPESTSETASGPATPPVDGKTASATPAALATGSAPATRVVFLVANSGNPRSCAAFGCGFFVWTTMRGAGATAPCFGSFLRASTKKYPPPPPPARTPSAAPPIANRRFQMIHTAGNGSPRAPARPQRHAGASGKLPAG